MGSIALRLFLSTCDRLEDIKELLGMVPEDKVIHNLSDSYQCFNLCVDWPVDNANNIGSEMEGLKGCTVVHNRPEGKVLGSPAS